VEKGGRGGERVRGKEGKREKTYLSKKTISNLGVPSVPAKLFSNILNAIFPFSAVVT
jgi:hypothetical protein